MGRNSPDRDEQRRLVMTYLADDRVPAEERSRVVLALVAHACVFLLLTAAEATWVLAVAVRLWRRRENGLTAAVRAGVHRPTLVGLLIAHLTYVVFRRIGLAKFNQLARRRFRR